MLNTLKIGLLLLLLFACSTTSMEFRSAKSAARAEKDFDRGEKFALQALGIEKDNALVPYFLATEIYEPQERWEEMAKMLDEAMLRNPKQELEKKFFLIPAEELTAENYKEMVVETIEKGVKTYREGAWTDLYNQAIENINSGINDVALEKLNLCLKMDSSRSEAYTTLAAYYASNQNFELAKEYVNKGLGINSSSSVLYEMNASLLYQEFQNSSDKSLLNDAEKMYLKATELAEDAAPIKKKLIFVYIDMNESQKAINLSNELLDIYYDDPDLYFNVGVLYQRLAKQLYDPATEVFNKMNAGDGGINKDVIKQLYTDFNQSKIYAKQSKDSFLDANDLEIEETGSLDASKEMRSLIKSLDIYISSTKELAISNGISIN